MAFNIDKKLKVKIISILIAFAGVGLLIVVGMAFFTNVLSSVTSMGTSAGSGMVEVPTIDSFFMQYLNTTMISEIIIGIILLIVGGIGYVWYPLQDLKNQFKNLFTPDTNIDEKIKAVDDMAGWKNQPLPKDVIVVNTRPRYRPHRSKKVNPE